MEPRPNLERRLDELEREVEVLRGSRALGVRGVRKRASWGLGNIPIYDIAVGPDLSRGELRGHAMGIVAIGDIATGFLAVGGLSRGVIALGGLAIGLVSLGGLSLGALLAIGGLAIGGAAFGGGAVGGVAVGGGAAGYYACGAGALGEHVVSAIHTDPEAGEFFAHHGISFLCNARR